MNDSGMNEPRPNEPRTTETIPRPERHRDRRWLGAAAAAALLVATPVAAHSGVLGTAPGTAGGPAFGSGHGGGMHGGAVAGRHGGAAGDAFGGMHGGMLAPLAPLAPLSPLTLQRLPLGTEVTVEAYDVDPADGAQPVATLSATVGETSEVAFADEVQAATADAAFVSVTTGRRTVRVALDAGTELRRTPLAGLMRFGALPRGQTVEIVFYADADDAAPSTTATFTSGQDSAAAFRERVAQAAAQAAFAEVALPAQERTLDLSATRRSEALEATPRPGDGMGRGHGPGVGRHGRPGAVQPGDVRPGAVQPGAVRPGAIRPSTERIP